MSQEKKQILIIYDDREVTSNEIQPLVGTRRYGEIIYRRRKIATYFHDVIPDWGRQNLHHLQTDDDVESLRKALEKHGEDCSAMVVAARAGNPDGAVLNQVIERLPYAEDSFTDRLYKPLLVFLKSALFLVEKWQDFERAPLHLWEQPWSDFKRITTIQPLDLSNIRDFLSFTCGSTETRHFNKVHIDTYYYTKSSTDKKKMQAEYRFFELVPEQMRPWLIQPFDYHEGADYTSYKMLRFYLADAALQWVHGAFDASTFGPFIERLLFFIKSRPRKPASKPQMEAAYKSLFVNKVLERKDRFLASDEGRRINGLLVSSNPSLDINKQVDRYLNLLKKYEKSFLHGDLVIGHGDPCFSNILYDQQRYLLKLLDPKGALTEEELWTHPLYDLCKISHSVLGEYDFINNGLYDIRLSDSNDLLLEIQHSNHAAMKNIFLEKIDSQGYDWKVMRLGEASLFLSMLPLHMDHPNKVSAFMLTAKQILDEIENG